MTETVVLAVVGALQAITIAYLEYGRRQAKRACGTVACVKAIKSALSIDEKGKHASNIGYPP